MPLDDATIYNELAKISGFELLILRIDFNSIYKLSLINEINYICET